MRTITYNVPKRGNSEDEYEDALALNGEQMSFAVSDGATESSFARCWAKLLVDDFTSFPQIDPCQWATRLDSLQDCWRQEVNGQDLPWYAEAKLEQGAAATFLGLSLNQRSLFGRRQWRALAIGDSCLFQVRQSRLLAKFPVKKAKEFGVTPVLINSRSPSKSISWRRVFQTKKGGWCENDCFFLMTDALAHWFLREYESDHQPWAEMHRLLNGNGDDQEFADWIRELRTNNKLRNDDVTLIAVIV